MMNIIRELLGRTAVRWSKLFVNNRPLRPTKDLTRADYQFWDNARRCTGQTQGLEISGLFLKPIASKVRGWTLGKMPRFKTDNDQLMERINQWFAEQAAEVGEGWEEALSLGDFFIVVNADLTITLITPDIVEPIVAEDNYSQVIGWRITQRFDHPTEFGRYMIEINEYTATERVRRVQFEKGDEQIATYPNLIGVVPVVHIPNNVQSNEVWGKPEAAALVGSPKGLLHRYGEILDAGTDGNLHQGRSTPVVKFKTAAGMQAFFNTYGETTVDEETGEESTYLDWDSDKLTALVDGEFTWESPSAFVGETEKLLAILYWIMIEHLELPEFVMGTAIASSKASAETQMPIFAQYIQKKRGQITGWMLQLAEVVARMTGLLEGMAVGDISIVWDSLTDADGKLTLEALQWAYGEGLIDKETALMLAPLPIEDVQEVLRKAGAEQEEREESMEVEMERMIAKAANPIPKPAAQGQGDSGEDEDELEDAA